MKHADKIKLYQQLYSEYYPRLMKTLHTITFSHADEREDIAQLTFERVWVAILNDQYDADLCEPFTWIYAIAKNCSIRNHENRVRQVPPYYIDLDDIEVYDTSEENDPDDEEFFITEVGGEGGYVLADHNSPENMLISEQDDEWLDDMIQALPERYREVVHLRNEGVPYKGIAFVLGIPPNTVATRLKRAKTILAENFLGEKTDESTRESSRSEGCSTEEYF